VLLKRLLRSPGGIVPYFLLRGLGSLTIGLFLSLGASNCLHAYGLIESESVFQWEHPWSALTTVLYFTIAVIFLGRRAR